MPWGVIGVLARYSEKIDKIMFDIIVEYNNESFIYRAWERKKFGFFDPNSVPDDEPKAVKLAEKIKHWPENLFKAWFDNQKRLRGTI